MITKDELAARLQHACAEVVASEAELTEIDSHFGDADHGLTMVKIANAIEGAVAEADGSIQEMLDDAAMAVMVLNGGSAVPLWNTWLDALQDATHPQNGMSFGDLGETDQMEIGAGQHGEGGGVRVPMASSKETVGLIAPKLVEHLGLAAGDKAFVMINGCGATTMMEQLILFKDTVEYLQGLGVEVVANMVGEILTVQEAGGFQMNIAKWDDEFVRLWNTPAHTPVFFKE